MQRLTQWNRKSNLAYVKEARENYTGYEDLDCSSYCKTQIDCGNCPIGKCFDKLAKYEDIGLSPEEVQRFRDAEEEERLIEFPVKIGDHVWQICSGATGYYIDEWKVTSYSILNSEDYLLDAVSVHEDENGYLEDTDIAIGKVGHTVFSSKQEAETRLKELEN